MARGESSTTQRFATLTCTHYNRGCNLVAPCCGRVVCCHHGHDADRLCPHRLEPLHARSAITTIVCTSCKKSQPISKKCRFCKKSFGSYHCRRCVLWDNGMAFHCDQCGYCIKGNQSKTRHCKTCRKCYPIESKDHVCCGFGDCSACGLSMKGSTERLHSTPCGHPMHEKCFIKRISKTYSCPRRDCRAPIANPTEWARSRRTASSQSGRNVIVSVHCNNCHRTSETRWANGAPRCGHCRSSSTTLLPPNSPVSGTSSHRRRRQT